MYREPSIRGCGRRLPGTRGPSYVVAASRGRQVTAEGQPASAGELVQLVSYDCTPEDHTLGIKWRQHYTGC